MTMVTPAKRIAQYPDQSFMVCLNNRRMVFCQCCAGSFGTSKQSIDQHVVTAKHRTRLAAWRTRKAEKAVLHETLVDGHDGCGHS